MNITLMSAAHGLSYFGLPAIVEGHFDLNLSLRDGGQQKVGDIQADQGEWKLVLMPAIERMSDPGTDQKPLDGGTVALSPMTFHQFRHARTGQMFTLFVESDSPEYKRFRLFSVPVGQSFVIGRTEGAIVYDCRFMSRQHVSVELNPSGMRVRDLNSTNGTYLNGKNVKEAQVHYGDILELYGLKMIILQGGIAINNVGDKIKLDDKLFRAYHLSVPDETSPRKGFEPEEAPPFERSPRIRRVISPERIELENPPDDGEGDSEMPAMLAMGASMTMGLSSGMMAISAIQNASNSGQWASAVPSIVMSAGMLSSSILFPTLTRRYERRRKREKAIINQNKYIEYLYEVVEQIKAIESTQKSILLETYLSTPEVCMMIDGVDRRLWNRRIEHDDFLTLRLGLGAYAPESELVFPKKGITAKSDPQRRALSELEARPHKMTDVPVLLNLRKSRVFGIVGAPEWTAKYAESLLVQLAAMHSPEEMKLVLLYRRADAAQWEYAKWFPHIWNDARDLRMLATDNEEVRQLSSYLEGSMAEAKDYGDDNTDAHYVVVSCDKSLLDRCSVLEAALTGERKARVSFIAIADRMSALPKECETILELRDGRGYLYEQVDSIGQLDSFVLEGALKKRARSYSTKLLNLCATGSGETANLPDVITFFDMFRIGRVEHLNAYKRWMESNPIETLSAPIGVDSYGDLFTLDIHQNAHGPHGLVAGMTGSGKSEFIITFLLSLAACYSPLEVGFILIDYKGGGMSDTLKQLPHTVGIIDNLGGRQGIRRSMVSIQSELSRRQRVFKEVAQKYEASNLDIHKYQGMVRDGKVKEPMQHLIIVSDEFAELKQQEPDFMDQLISAARIGRSLGVHLILATQKPTGVVNDQILSNTRFRACLKVQDKTDSMDMINRADAASLTKTGRFYLQVGYNEIFAMGQSAWSGASTVPQDRYVEPVDESIQVINDLGQVTYKAQATSEAAKDGAKPRKQVDDTVSYLARVAEDHELIPAQLWKPMLSGELLLSDVTGYGNGQPLPFMHPAIGVVDDPTVQQQFPLLIPARENVLLYGATGSGKSVFINAILMELTTKYSPDQVNIFILDFDAQASRAFHTMPHVGDIIVAGEDEKVRNFIKLISSEAERRRNLFKRFGGDIDIYRQETGDQIPNILVVLQNYSSFSELYEREEEALYPFARDGQRYGISFLFTATSMSSIRFRVTQNFKHTYCLQLNDPLEYTTLLGRTEGIAPMSRCGSGIYRDGERVLEFQVGALFSAGTDREFDRIEQIGKETARKYSGKAAARVKTMLEQVRVEDLITDGEAPGLAHMPVGYSVADIEPLYVDFTARYIHMMLYATYDPAFERGLCELLTLNPKRLIYILDPNRNIKCASAGNCTVVSRGNGVQAAIKRLFDEVVLRYNACDLAEEEQRDLPTFPEMVVYASGLSDVFDQLDVDHADKLGLILEKGSTRMNVVVIFTQAASTVSRLTAKDWYIQRMSAVDGYWLGDGLLDQYTFHVNAQRSRIEANKKMAFVINSGEPTAFKPVHA